jgi:threonine synthase
MRLISTEGKTPPTPLHEALRRGLAPDGGLYMPESLPRIPPGQLETMRGRSWEEVATTVAGHLLSTAVDPSALDSLLKKALDFPIPLVPLKDRIYVLELFHGPTLAFKDVGARFMAGLMAYFRLGTDDPVTVLTATSGDTGGAVAQAFLGRPGIRVVVLFPDGKITPRQERQFSTLGQNVMAVAVQGDFDDCQRLAKAAFQDGGLRESVNLTSANSINVGRLLPQMFYYFQAWAQMPSDVLGTEDGRAEVGGPTAPEFLFSVPSGNFGNLAAGLMAKGLGLGGARFLASTNVNDGVPRFLETGRFTPRPSVPTLSSAMDVGNPSNLSRILHLYDGNLPSLTDDLVGRSISDEETTVCIRRTYEDFGYVLDPHSAVGLAALEREMEARPGITGILLATAHPAKFAEVVEPVLGHTLPIPSQLARCLEGNRTVVPIEPEEDALREFLLRT